MATDKQREASSAATLLKRVEWYVREGLWQEPAEEQSALRRFAVRVARVLMLTIRFFTAKGVLSKSAALTYSTILAIVPILAVVFAVARGFGFNKYIEVWFLDLLSSQPQAAEAIVGFVNSYLVHTHSGVFLGVGLVFMLYTVLMLVSNIEQTFNELWQVKKQRSFFRTVTDYLAMFFLLPILIVVSSGLSIFISSLAAMAPGQVIIGPMTKIMLDISPYVLMSALFIALYVFMPNTHVRIRNAIVPGILAGIAMQGLQFFYIHSQIWMTGYNAIYGSFAAIPLFMLWVQLSWVICLFGAELTYASQNMEYYYDYDSDTAALSHRSRLLYASLIMQAVCHRFQDAGKPYSASDLRQATGLPLRIVNETIYLLIDANLLVEIATDEKGQASQYIPAMSLEHLTVGKLIDSLEAQGRSAPKLDLAGMLQGRWKDALANRSKYLEAQRDIRLQDL